MNRNLVRLFLVLLPFVPLASAADSGRGQPPLLVVQINGGKVALTTRNSGLGEGELNVLRTLLEERVREMPGWESGRLTLRLRERALEKLQPKLQEAARGELRNPDLLTELIEDEVDFEYDPEGEADSPDQTRVFIGRDFHLGPDTALEQVVAIGSRGVVEGDVEELVAIGSDIRLGPSARVGETLVALGSHLDRHPEAEITAEEVDITLPGNGFFWSGLGEKLERAEAFAWPLRILNRLALILSALLLGFLYLTVFPDFSARVRHFLVEEKAAAFGYGVLGFAGVFPAVLLLVLTLVGIFLVPLFLLAVAILVTAGYLDLASVIGRATLKERARHPFWPLAAGVLILQLVGLVPWIGGAIVLFATCAGYGAVLKVTLGQWKGRRKTGTEAVS